MPNNQVHAGQEIVAIKEIPYVAKVGERGIASNPSSEMSVVEGVLIGVWPNGYLPLSEEGVVAGEQTHYSEFEDALKHVQR